MSLKIEKTEWDLSQLLSSDNDPDVEKKTRLRISFQQAHQILLKISS